RKQRRACVTNVNSATDAFLGERQAYDTDRGRVRDVARYVGRDHHHAARQGSRKRHNGKGWIRRAALWLVLKRPPTTGQTRIFEAVLAALADHGFVPSTLAARLTHY